jgi:outer membrane protein TolC
MELIMAQKNALLSQLELVQYNKQQHIAMVNLYRALGGGWK